MCVVLLVASSPLSPLFFGFYFVFCSFRHLWVGCTGSIKIVDLVTLESIKAIDVPSVPGLSAPPVVMVRSLTPKTQEWLMLLVYLEKQLELR